MTEILLLDYGVRMKTIKTNTLESLFPGDEQLALSVLEEMKGVTAAVDSLSALVSKELPREQSVKLVKDIANSYGGFITSLVLPIYLKFPHLDKEPENLKSDKKS